MSTHGDLRGSGAAVDRGPSPYLIGAAIGLLNICAFAAFRKGIGVSGAYESSAELAGGSPLESGSKSDTEAPSPSAIRINVRRPGL